MTLPEVRVPGGSFNGTSYSGAPSFSVTLYNGATVLGEITAAQLDTAASATGYAWSESPIPLKGEGFEDASLRLQRPGAACVSHVLKARSQQQVDCDGPRRVQVGMVLAAAGGAAEPLPATVRFRGKGMQNARDGRVEARDRVFRNTVPAQLARSLAQIFAFGR